MTTSHNPLSGEATVSLSDLSLARAVALAVCRVPGVLAMSPGHFAVEATYGPGERVVGVVLHRPASDMLVITVRVTIAEQVITAAFHKAAKQMPASTEHSPLDQLTDRIRAAVAQTAHQMGVHTLTAINVAIDDIGHDQDSPA